MADTFKANRPVRVSRLKTYPTGYEGEMPELTAGDEAHLTKIGAIEATDNSSVDAWDDRTPAIKVAVGLAMDADPARESQPTVKVVEAHLEFKDVKAAEIATAYDELLEERTAPSGDDDDGEGDDGGGSEGDNDNGDGDDDDGTAPQE